MNLIALLSAAAAGFCVSILVMDAARLLAGSRWPQQAAGLQFERRALPWLLALVAGPALLWERARMMTADPVLPLAQRLLAVAMTAAWATVYGMVVIGVMKRFAFLLGFPV